VVVHPGRTAYLPVEVRSILGPGEAGFRSIGPEADTGCYMVAGMAVVGMVADNRQGVHLRSSRWLRRLVLGLRMPSVVLWDSRVVVRRICPCWILVMGGDVRMSLFGVL